MGLNFGGLKLDFRAIAQAFEVLCLFVLVVLVINYFL
jgi:hypothetical protein